MVDDETSILTITSQTLQAFGYRVLTAGDGAEAVGLYAQHRHEIAHGKMITRFWTQRKLETSIKG